MFDDVIVVYKFIGDLMFFVTGSQDENELILCQVLQGFYESISLLLRCSWVIAAQSAPLLPSLEAPSIRRFVRQQSVT